MAGSIDVPIWEKYSLSIQEAAKYFGVGEKRIRFIISQNRNADFILEIGTHVKIKRELFAKYLNEATVV